MIDALRKYLIWVLYVALVSIVVVSYYKMFYSFEPVRVDKFLVEKSEVERGECLTFQFIGEKFMDIPVHATVELVNGERIAVMSYTSNNPVGTVFKRRTMIVPTHTVPGKYRLKWTGVYEVNSLNTVTKVAYSDWIVVK